MRHLKKMTALLVAVVMMMALSAVAWAAGEGTITVKNASKGETYKVVKIFDATIGANGEIAYSGTIPEGLDSFFEYTDAAKSNVQLKKDADETALIEKLQELYGSDTTGGVKAEGAEVVFNNLDYGYYVVSTTQGESAITVTSISPSPEVYDKNTTTPTAAKTVDDKDVYIGETVTYTLTFDTTNWIGQGSDAKQVVKYEIADTLPNYLSDVEVKSIKIDADGNLDTKNDVTELTIQQFVGNKITLDWATGSKGAYTNICNNGAKIIITYTAKVTSSANVGDADGNRNVVTLTPYVDNGKDNPEPTEKTYKDEETIKTYGAAIHKVDDKGNSLTGAKFTIKGLEVSGDNGMYTVTAYDASESATAGTEMTVDNEGYIYILGLPSDISLSVTETVAPQGYNKLTEAVNLTPIKMSQTTTYTEKTVYYDAEGKVAHETVAGGTSKQVTANYTDLKKEANVLAVENNAGTTLPSTGGMGTTILYIVGAVLIIGAVVLLITRRRLNAEK